MLTTTVMMTARGEDKVSVMKDETSTMLPQIAKTM
jgi:hypothetical protein